MRWPPRQGKINTGTAADGRRVRRVVMAMVIREARAVVGAGAVVGMAVGVSSIGVLGGKPSGGTGRPASRSDTSGPPRGGGDCGGTKTEVPDRDAGRLAMRTVNRLSDDRAKPCYVERAAGRKQHHDSQLGRRILVRGGLKRGFCRRAGISAPAERPAIRG